MNTYFYIASVILITLILFIFFGAAFIVGYNQGKCEGQYGTGTIFKDGECLLNSNK